MTEPLLIPPAGAVYVNVIVRPFCDALTADVPDVSVPDPSAALTVMLGEEPRLAREPAEVDLPCACQVCAPVLEVEVAPGPPPAVEP